MKAMTCPFTGERLTAVAAITPRRPSFMFNDRMSSAMRNAWGNLGVTGDACLASRHVILTAEEIVPPDVISRDPNRVITPGFRVSAVVHFPWRHPPVAGSGLLQPGSSGVYRLSEREQNRDAFCRMAKPLGRRYPQSACLPGLISDTTGWQGWPSKIMIVRSPWTMGTKNELRVASGLL